MTFEIRGLWFGLAVLFASSACAQQSANGAATHIFVCKDAGGRTITSDRPIPECADRPMEERSKGGTVLREIPAPLTPEEQQQKDARERKRREQEEQEKDQARKDRALLAVYASEESIQSARERSLSDYQDALKNANQNMAALLDERKANQREADHYKSKPIPLTLQHQIDANEAAISGEGHTIADRQAAIDRINQKFDADLARFRSLEAKYPNK